LERHLLFSPLYYDLGVHALNYVPTFSSIPPTTQTLLDFFFGRALKLTWEYMLNIIVGSLWRCIEMETMGFLINMSKANLASKVNQMVVNA
jgi:hypothetical protein